MNLSMQKKAVAKSGDPAKGSVQCRQPEFRAFHLRDFFGVFHLKDLFCMPVWVYAGFLLSRQVEMKHS